MRVLVTGGAGFIGSNLVRELLTREHSVKVLDNLSTGFKSNLEGLDIDFIEGDIQDQKAVCAAVDGCDAVFHLAALPSVIRSMKDPVSTTEVNVNGTVNLLDEASRVGVKRFVFSSSSSVYGDQPEPEKSESLKPAPLSPYAASKLSGEYYCSVFARSLNLETVALRYFNVFGPGQDPDSEYAAVMPRFIKRLMGGKGPQIYGDGLQSRDFTPVSLVVEANILAATVPGVSGSVFNVACGKRLSVNELAAQITAFLAEHIPAVKDLKPEYLPERPGDIKHSLADTSAISENLGLKLPSDITQYISEVCDCFYKRYCDEWSKAKSV